MPIEEDLSVFKKRNPQEKQEYIIKLFKENRILKKKIEKLETQMKTKEETTL